MVLPFLVAESFRADDRGFLLSLERPLFGMATLIDSYLILNNDCRLLELEGWVHGPGMASGHSGAGWPQKMIMDGSGIGM